MSSGCSSSIISCIACVKLSGSSWLLVVVGDDGETFPTEVLIEPRGSAGYSCMVPGNLIVGLEPGKNIGGILYESPNVPAESKSEELGIALTSLSWKSFEVPPKPTADDGTMIYQ